MFCICCCAVVDVDAEFQGFKEDEDGGTVSGDTEYLH